MSMTFEQFSELVKMAALVVGGLWTVWKFGKVQEARTANLIIEKGLLELRETRTRLLSLQPQLSMELKVHESASPSQRPGSFLLITVKLKNEGQQNLDTRFDDSALTVGQIVFGQDGRQKVQHLHRSRPLYFAENSDEAEPVPERVFRVGQQRQMEFAVPFTKPGFYLVQFRTQYARRPFEGEKPSRRAPEIIAAYEETIFHATGEAHPS